MTAPRERLHRVPLAEVAEVAGPQAFAAVAPQKSTLRRPMRSQRIHRQRPGADLSHTPSGWYTPVAHYYFSARFGVPGGWSSGHHTGLDFVTKQGSPIRAATDGVVVAADWAGAYTTAPRSRSGRRCRIWMAHLDQFKVSKGDVVKAGQVDLASWG